MFGLPQGSILGPSLLNVFICVMCYFLEDLTIMLTTLPPYNADKNIELDVNDLDHSSSILLKWLKDNYMKVSTGKRHHLVSGITAKIDDNYIGYKDH